MADLKEKVLKYVFSHLDAFENSEEGNGMSLYTGGFRIVYNPVAEFPLSVYGYNPKIALYTIGYDDLEADQHRILNDTYNEMFEKEFERFSDWMDKKWTD